jgi:hypothetical protein
MGELWARRRSDAASDVDRRYRSPVPLEGCFLQFWRRICVIGTGVLRGRGGTHRVLELVAQENPSTAQLAAWQKAAAGEVEDGRDGKVEELCDFAAVEHVDGGQGASVRGPIGSQLAAHTSLLTASDVERRANRSRTGTCGACPRWRAAGRPARPRRHTFDVPRIVNSETLESRLGSWPSFHDAEVLSVRLDSGQRSDGRARLELDIHVFDVDGQLPDGRLNFVRHTIATLEFAGVESLELDGFGPQNVLDDLVLRDLATEGATTATIKVELPSNNGLAGGFRCEQVTVLAARPYTPGVHSVYSR